MKDLAASEGVFLDSEELSVDDAQVPGGVEGHPPHHAPFQPILLSQDFFNGVELGEASIDDEFEVGEVFFELEDPVVLEDGNVSIVLGVESMEEALASMDDELGDAALDADDLDEVEDVFVLVEVVDAEAALDGHRDAHLLPHLRRYLRHQFWIFHQNSPKAAISGLVAGAAAVHIHLIEAVLLNDLGGHRHLHRVVPAQLTDHWVLVWSEVQELVSELGIEDCVLIEHLCVEVAVLGEQTHEEPEVLVTHLYHGSDREVLPRD
mmetsp:Transcript_26258/g.25425  ORF Transcript_26258/g.25425 Transcript_26258/m.25425 type:complete len:264 (-) Transcript_26258:30-821(-)